MLPSAVEPRQHPSHWSLGLKLDAADQHGMSTRQLCIFRRVVSLPIKMADTMAFKAQRHVGQDSLWAGEEKADRGRGGPQEAALDSLLKEAITGSKEAPWEGAEQGRGIQGPGLLRKWALDLAAGPAPPGGPSGLGQWRNSFQEGLDKGGHIPGTTPRDAHPRDAHPPTWRAEETSSPASA